MKKTLLRGTALTAGLIGVGVAAPAQAQIELGLGGFMQQYFGYGNSDTNVGDALGLDNDGWNGFDVKSNSEIWFVGSTTLDNGLKLGVNIQLEGNSNADDQIDESFLFVEGAFGRFNLGSENSAGYLMTYAAPNVGVGVNSTDILTGFLPMGGAFTSAGFFRGPLGTTYLELDRNNDSEKLTYFTPRFSGFQFGASYIPDPQQDSNLQANEETVSFRNGFSFGANFVESFEGIDVAVSGRYDFAEDESPLGTDPSLWSVGANVGYAGFTVGGSYASSDDMGANTGRSFDVGASYETGPWGISFTYFNGKADGAPVPGDDEYEAYEGAAAYALGPGVTLVGSVSYQNLEAESGASSETWAVLTGFKLTF